MTYTVPNGNEVDFELELYVVPQGDEVNFQLEDTQIITETLYETFTSDDTITKSSTTTITETLNSNDGDFKHLDLNYTESISSNDMIDNLINKKSLETINSNDSIDRLLNLNRILQETINSNDVLNITKFIQRILTETIDGNDSLLPLIIPKLLETINTNDIIKREFVVSLLEILNSNDITIKSINKDKLLETLSSNDNVISQIIPKLLEILSLSDGDTKVVESILKELFSLNDVIIKNIEKDKLIEIINTNDNTISKVINLFNENIYLEDSLNIGSSWNFDYDNNEITIGMSELITKPIYKGDKYIYEITLDYKHIDQDLLDNIDVYVILDDNTSEKIDWKGTFTIPTTKEFKLMFFNRLRTHRKIPMYNYQGKPTLLMVSYK